MIEKYFDVAPLFVEPGVKTGLSILMDNPLEVGADRIERPVCTRRSVARNARRSSVVERVPRVVGDVGQAEGVGRFNILGGRYA